MNDLEAAIRRKADESARTKQEFFAANAERIAACARALAAAFDRGGRLYTAGNGGSACDAEHAALEFLHPAFEKRPSLPAQALSADAGYLTAVGNDQDFALVFARRLRLLARAGDVLLALSTSGRSASVLRALGAARELGVLTVGLTGGDGGPMPALCDHAFVVPSFSIHRIQEVHGTLVHILWDVVHVVRGEEDTR
jgi:D-sedoheptulose 7-phosphate isomerase